MANLGDFQIREPWREFFELVGNGGSEKKEIVGGKRESNAGIEDLSDRMRFLREIHRAEDPVGGRGEIQDRAVVGEKFQNIR